MPLKLTKYTKLTVSIGQIIYLQLLPRTLSEQSSTYLVMQQQECLTERQLYLDTTCRTHSPDKLRYTLHDIEL